MQQIYAALHEGPWCDDAVLTELGEVLHEEHFRILSLICGLENRVIERRRPIDPRYEDEKEHLQEPIVSLDQIIDHNAFEEADRRSLGGLTPGRWCLMRAEDHEDSNGHDEDRYRLSGRGHPRGIHLRVLDSSPRATEARLKPRPSRRLRC